MSDNIIVVDSSGRRKTGDVIIASTASTDTSKRFGPDGSGGSQWSAASSQAFGDGWQYAENWSEQTKSTSGPLQLATFSTPTLSTSECYEVEISGMVKCSVTNKYAQLDLEIQPYYGKVYIAQSYSTFYKSVGATYYFCPPIAAVVTVYAYLSRSGNPAVAYSKEVQINFKRVT